MLGHNLFRNHQNPSDIFSSSIYLAYFYQKRVKNPLICVLNLKTLGKILFSSKMPEKRESDVNAERSIWRRAFAGSIFGLYNYMTVYREITKVVSDAEGQPLNQCTEKYGSPGSIPGAYCSIGALIISPPASRWFQALPGSSCKLVNERLI